MRFIGWAAMFDFVHQNKRLVRIVLLLIILPFAFWGVDSYNQSTRSESLAKVNGEIISQQEFDQALRQQQGRMQEMQGSKYDQAMFDTPEIKRGVLENLVSQRLLILQAHAAGLAVSDQQLAQAIAGNASFQKDGKFDKQLYEMVLRNQGISPLAFQMRVAQDLNMRQLTDAYIQNGYASHTVADNILRLNEQQRVVAVVQVTPDSFFKAAKVDEPAVKDYYQKNLMEFQVDEQVRVEYLTFSADGIQAEVTVGEDEIKKYYEEHQPEFGTQEQRQAAHILISVPAKASDSDKQVAKTKAEQILQQIKQSPEKFSDLAKQYSQDTGSADNGGDLGFFGSGAMVKPFEEAVFKLKPGEISGLVQSDFGFHIIKLLAVKPAIIQPLSDASNTIMQRLKLQKSNDKFAEMAEKFNSTVYEQSDTLKPAADMVKMPLQQSTWLTKRQPETLLWTAKALQAVFTEDVMKNKRNSAVVEIAPNILLAARLLEHKPSSTRSLAEVGEYIRQKLQRQQALGLAMMQGKMMLAQLQRGEKVGLAWKPAVTVTHEKHTGLDNSLARQVFQVSASKLPAYVGVESATEGYFLARVEEVKDVAVIDDTNRARYAQQLRQMMGDELFQAFLADTKKHADIEITAFTADDKK